MFNINPINIKFKIALITININTKLILSTIITMIMNKLSELIKINIKQQMPFKISFPEPWPICLLNVGIK